MVGDDLNLVVVMFVVHDIDCIDAADDFVGRELVTDHSDCLHRYHLSYF